MTKQGMEHFKGSENTLYDIIVMETHHYMCACVLSCFSRVRLCATLWTVAHQAPLSMGLSMQETGMAAMHSSRGSS